MKKLSQTQMQMLRRLYRHQLKKQGWHNTEWTSEVSLHKSSVESLVKRGLVERNTRPQDIKLPSGEVAPAWSMWPVYRLTADGIRIVEANSPVLIGDTIEIKGRTQRVVSWGDDYRRIETEDQFFVDPLHVRVVEAGQRLQIA